MTLMTTVQGFPRVVINGYLSAARLPLTAMQRVAGQGDNQQWPPALAFDGFEAGLETILGSLLRDERLAEKGRLRRARLSQLQEAAALETIAEQTRQQASAVFAERIESSAQQRQAAERKADQRQRHVEQQAERRQRTVARQTAAKAAAVREVKANQHKMISQQQQAATVDALAAEAQALDAQQRALSAAETVDRIDAAIAGTKAARTRR